ncbi:MAG: nickel-dependent lactate racemase [Pseudomonadota bacterium]
MDVYVNYGSRRQEFSLPDGWNVISGEDKPPVPGVSDPLQEVKRALDHPIGSPKIEELATSGMEVVLLFDDLQRPTPAHLILPEIMNRLNRAGVPDERIKAVCALGTHPVLSLEQMRPKVGEEAFSRLHGRLFCHDPHASDNVIIGKTHRGTLVEINPHAAAADLIIGIGECMPHPTAGYGGGYKIVMPGISSYRSVAEHHFAWMRHPGSRVNHLEGNYYWEEIVDAGRISRLAFKIDSIINPKKEIVRSFAGDPLGAHREASRYAEKLYLVSLPKLADVTITSAFPLEMGVQSTKALALSKFSTRAGGTVIWIAPQKEAGPIMPLIKEMASPDTATDFHRRLIEGDVPEHLRQFGISYIMQIVFFKAMAERFKVVHVTEGLSPDQVRMMKYSYSATVQDAVDLAAREMPRADVAVFPSGGNIIPRVG